MVTTEADLISLLDENNSALVRRLEALSVRAWMPEWTYYDRTWACRWTPVYPSWRLNCITPLDPSDDENIEVRLQRLCRGEKEIFSRKKIVMRLTPLASPAIREYCRDNNWKYSSPVFMLFSPLSRMIACLHQNKIKKEILSSIQLESVSEAFYVDVSLRTHDFSSSIRTSLIKILRRIIGRKTFFIGFKNKIPVANTLVVCDNDLAGLLDLAILKSLRQTKLEYMFFLSVLQQLQRMDIAGVWLQVKAENKAVLHMCKSFGFIPCYSYVYSRLD